MFTNLKNIQIIVSLLKQFGIRHLVLSPGTRNAPLVHSVESDPFFTCYSFVDERSAGYFAKGLALAINEPVCLSCTSSTATCNYMPAIKEAYEENIPLIALTADRNYYKLFQLEDQMIDQRNMYGKYTNFYANLPEIQDKNEEWYCIRQVNEALHAVKNGPVQINFEVNKTSVFDAEEIPVYRKIDILEKETIQWENIQKVLMTKKRILVICGQNYPIDQNLTQALLTFQQKYNCVVSVDHISNSYDSNLLKTVLVAEAMTNVEFKKYLPDLVITIGKNIWSAIKSKLRHYGDDIEHWRVSSDGEIYDGFRALSTVFKIKELDFFTNINSYAGTSNGEYFKLWNQRINQVKYPDLKFSNFSVIHDLIKIIPKHSVLHATILNATRIINFQEMDSSITCYSNLGADGIDGGFSAFLGESDQLIDQLSFLVTGDLSFIYDLNAFVVGLHHNQRILIINNFAGGEFHTNFSVKSIPDVNLHIAAGHKSRLGGMVNNQDVVYLAANNQKELDLCLTKFIAKSNKPIILEVFTDAETDSAVLKMFYSLNKKIESKTKLKAKLKRFFLKS